jgi:hypothetical protein
MLEAMARIAPSQLNEAMERIASRNIVPFHSTSNQSAFDFRVGFSFPCEEDWAKKGVRRDQPPPSPRRTHNLAFSLAAI